MMHFLIYVGVYLVGAVTPLVIFLLTIVFTSRGETKKYS